MIQQNESQDSIYALKEVNVRLCLKEGTSLYSTIPIQTPEDAVWIMQDALRDLDREMVCVVNLDTKGKPINFNVVSIGGIDRAWIPVQNVFKSSILSNAASLLLIHNHPSGDITPSSEDIMTTKQLVEAGKLMNIPVVDHIVIGAMSDDFYSFRKEQEDMFQNPTIDMDCIHAIQKQNGRKKTKVRG